MSTNLLPPQVHVFVRDWLSANHVLLRSRDGHVLIDSGYVRHAPLTLALLESPRGLAGEPLARLVNTHGHSDHTAGNNTLQQAYKTAKTVAHKQTKNQTDLRVHDGDNISIGKVSIQVIYTPGHTPEGICLLIDNQKLLTGDTLFIGECGRTDLPGGDPKQLYQSLFQKILRLSDTIEVYPGHNYGAKPSSTIGYERKTNYVLQPRTQDEFVNFMD